MKVGLTLGGIIVVVIVGAVTFALIADNDWQQYALQHHCVKVDSMSVGGVAAGKTHYICDKGEEYWR